MTEFRSAMTRSGKLITTTNVQACPWILTRGPRKDQFCGAKTKDDEHFCSKHKPKPTPNLAKVSIWYVQSVAAKAEESSTKASAAVVAKAEESSAKASAAVVAKSASKAEAPAAVAKTASMSHVCPFLTTRQQLADHRDDGLFTVGDLITALTAFDLNTPIYYSTDAEGNETCAVDFLPSAAKIKAYKRRFAQICSEGEDGLPIVIIN